jgi:3-oxoacyl-[acyl-carrier-protein] synthase II
MRRNGRTVSKPDHDGEIMTIKDCLVSAGLSPSDIDVVFAHATATKAGDSAEAEALKSVFLTGTDTPGPLVTATKAATGHAVGAACALDAVAAVITLVRGIVPPIYNLDEDDIDPFARRLRLVARAPVTTQIGRVMVHGLGLGGEDGAAIFESPEAAGLLSTPN